ncbi:MAG: aminopeptidase P family N-terminal domain-containing protein, partial [Paracoccaceae bacterium]
MFQGFDETAQPELGPARLAALRGEMARDGLDAFVIPRADAHQGEYVAPRDDRLAWLTGFTGSAGTCIVLADKAGVFVDGRYRVQVRDQVAPVFTPVDWPETSLAEWLTTHLPAGARIGFDPWLMPLETQRDVQLRIGNRRLVSSRNLVDAIWHDQPEPPLGPIFEQPVPLTGEPREAKLARIAAALAPARATVLTLPDSIAWLLNIRGRDIPRNPVPHCFAILHDTGALDLFIAPEKCGQVDLGAFVTCHAPDAFLPALTGLEGPVRIDPASIPVAVVAILEEVGCTLSEAADPCILPKACKTTAELEGARAAHLRDGAAMARFLAWLDGQPIGTLTEIDVVKRLEEERRATNALRDISFDTISGTGPNGAIVHYRVTEASNRTIQSGDLLLVDSGGQYVDGTTDITRTLAVGPV